MKGVTALLIAAVVLLAVANIWLGADGHPMLPFNPPFRDYDLVVSKDGTTNLKAAPQGFNPGVIEKSIGSLEWTAIGQISPGGDIGNSTYWIWTWWCRVEVTVSPDPFFDEGWTECWRLKLFDEEQWKTRMLGGE